MSGHPTLNFWQIWNMCFGFMGIQFGFALQNANVSRIFQTLGADYNNMTILWLAAPVTGLIVQPIVGYYSDKTWGSLGRRRPYFLYGAIAASMALLVMPNSPTLWIAAGTLWVLDASINIAMEPFRAFVGDMLPPSQRGLGYALQSFFIGVGSVVASALPWIMSNAFDVSSTAAAGVIPDSVAYAFYIGALFFLGAVLWTVFTTDEYSPEQLLAFQTQHEKIPKPTTDQPTRSRLEAAWYLKLGILCLFLGFIATGLVWYYIEALDRNLFIMTVGLSVFGLLQIVAGFLKHRGLGEHGFAQAMDDLFTMPAAMRKLAVVQFFSWFPFFVMWSSTTLAVTSFHYGTSDTTSAAYNSGADWVGILFSIYNATAVLAAIAIPLMGRYLSLKQIHMTNLCLGGAGYVSFVFIQDPHWLVIPMIGVGFAWASILSIPYALLSTSLPYQKMGLYMGIFNFFIVLPQILAASILAFLVERFFSGEPIYALVIGGCSLFLAGALTLRVESPTANESNA